MEDLDILKLGIKQLFSSSLGRNLNEQVSHVSKYYAYLADALDYQRLNIAADPELVQQFESVFLWLQDRLVVYPDSIRRQVSKIVEENSLCDLFAILSVLSPREIHNIQRNRLVTRFVLSALPFFSRLPQIDGFKQLTTTNVLKAKMALIRLSQVLEFAASVEVLDYDESFVDFKDNFDPNIVDKNKLLTLVSYLHVQVNSISDEAVRSRFVKKLADLEAEIHKPKVRWGVVITGFFILLGFAADLKTMDPTIYGKPLRTINSILSVLHEDGLVNTKRKNLLSEGDPLENSNDDAEKILDPKAGPPRQAEACD